jgi:CBS domain-containing protein
MALDYRVIEVFTSEEARYKGHPLGMALVQRIHDLRIAARCMVLRGIAGCYENGEIATHGIEVLSFNMPLKIEIILPASELGRVLPMVEEMVTDGIVVVEEMDMRVHKVSASVLPRNLHVTDIMTRNPHSVTPDTPAAEIVKLLLTHPFNGVPVIDERGKPVGIVTQGDLIQRAGMPIRLGLLKDMAQDNLDATLREMSKKQAKEIMTSPVTTVSQDLPVQQAVRLMLDKGLKRMPVVNHEGSVTGILSRFDIFRTATRETPDWQAIQGQSIQVGNIRRVGEILSRDVHAVKVDASIEAVMRIIDENDIQRVVVVNDTGKLLGMILDSDLLRLFSGHRVGIWDRIASRLTFTAMGQRHKAAIEEARKRTAGEVMRKDLITVTEDATLDEAIRLMTDHNIKRLPVVERDGTFLGMISRDALLRLSFQK